MFFSCCGFVESTEELQFVSLILHESIWGWQGPKETVENLRGIVDKWSIKESVNLSRVFTLHCANGQGKGSEGFYDGKHKTAKLRGHPRDSSEGTVFPHCPKCFQYSLRLSKSFAGRLALSVSRMALSVCGLALSSGACRL